MSRPVLEALLLVVTGVTVYGLSRLLRARLPLRDVDPAPWAGTLSYVATAYGVIIGFSIIFLFGEFSDARQAVGDEATAIGTAFDEASLYPESRSNIQSALICYAQSVPEYDWPAMRSGEPAPQVDVAFDDVVDSVGKGDIDPVGALHSATATNLVAQIGGISSARETRLVAAETQVPMMLWVLLFGGGALVATMIFVVTLPAKPGAQAALVAFSSIFTVVLMLLVLALSEPFADAPGRVTPELIQQTSASMVSTLPSSDTVHCDVTE
jgi:amino acid transporter